MALCQGPHFLIAHSGETVMREPVKYIFEFEELDAKL